MVLQPAIGLHQVDELIFISVFLKAIGHDVVYHLQGEVLTHVLIHECAAFFSRQRVIGRAVIGYHEHI